VSDSLTLELLKEWRSTKLTKARAKKATPATIRKIQLEYKRALARLQKAASAPASGQVVHVGGGTNLKPVEDSIAALDVRVGALEAP
jgi:ribosome recycling factor